MILSGDSQTLKPNLAIRLQDRKTLYRELFLSIMKLAKLYAVPQFDNTNGELLTEWILDEYKHQDLDLIQETLRNPPRLNDQAWRLTPDTLREWIDLTRIKRADLKIKEESQKRQETINENMAQLSPETQKMVADYIASLMPEKTTYQMTKEEIKEEGKIRPKQKRAVYNSTPKEEVIMKELKRRYYIECYDKYTGKPLDNWLSFEEWKLL